MSHDVNDYQTLAEFWPYYLSEHLNPVNRGLHVVGTLSGVVWLGLAVAYANPWLILAALVNGYGFAWIGHFVIEKNRPATFKYPLMSFLGDWVLLAHTLSGQISDEVDALREPLGQAG